MTTESSAPSSAPCTLRIPPPPPFNGKGNVVHWVTRLRSYFRAHNATDQNIQREFFISLLEGPALDWYLHTIACLADGSLGEYESMKAVFHDFQSFFSPVNDKYQAESELSRLRQQDSVKQYIEQFYEVTIRIPDMTNQDKRRWFLHGLRPAIRRELQRNSPETLESAQKMALVYDTSFTMTPRQSQGPNPVFSRSSPPANGPTPMDVDAVRVPGRLTDAERDYLKRNRGCFSCRKLGHLASACPTFRARKNVSVHEIDYQDPECFYAQDGNAFKSEGFQGSQ